MTDTLTPEMLRTAAKVAELKGYDGTRKIYAEEAEALEKTLRERTYIDELAEHGFQVWAGTGQGDYWDVITKAVVKKLTEDGHLDLDEPPKVWDRAKLELGKVYTDCEGDRVEWRGGHWCYWVEADEAWLTVRTNAYAPFTLVE